MRITQRFLKEKLKRYQESQEYLRGISDKLKNGVALDQGEVEASLGNCGPSMGILIFQAKIEVIKDLLTYLSKKKEDAQA